MKWPHLRAALITAQIMAMALVSLPAPSRLGLTAKAAEPDLSEVRPWARLLRVDERALFDHAMAAGRSWLDVRDRLLGPVERYLALVGAQQQWHMFSTPNRRPTRFVLEFRREALADQSADWEFLSGLPAGKWHREFFQSERSRSLINVIGRYDGGSIADALCLHLAQAALAEDATRAEIRCQFIRTPTAPAQGEPLVIYSRVVSR